MTTVSPNILAISIEKMNDKINNLKDLGYSLHEVIKITTYFPSIFCFSKESIREKIEYLKSIGLSSVVVNRPKCLIQGVELTYARYRFFKTIGRKINERSCADLFISKKDFLYRYDISNGELFHLYPYKSNIKKLNKINL